MRDEIKVAIFWVFVLTYLFISTEQLRLFGIKHTLFSNGY